MTPAQTLAIYVLSHDLESAIADQDLYLQQLSSFSAPPLFKHESASIFLQLLQVIGKEDAAKVILPKVLHQELEPLQWQMVLRAQQAAILSRLPAAFQSIEDAAKAAVELEMIFAHFFLSEGGLSTTTADRKLADEEKLKLFNRELREKENELHQLISHAPDAIIVINADGIITLWNDKAEEIFGWSADEALGKPLAETIVPPAYRSAHAAGMDRYLKTREAHVLDKSIEITALKKTGEEFHISLKISHFKKGEKDVFIAFLRDIEEQKKKEKELRRKQSELEQSNMELEQYAWLTSHDLREPLRKILTYSDLILSHEAETVPEKVRSKLEKISASATRMGNLIKAMLTYSSINDETQQYLPTSLNDVIEEVLSDLELTIHETNAAIFKDDLPVVEAIPHQMRQLFQNLITNAIKYRKPALDPIIHITAKNYDANNIAIQVRDNGVGFEKKDEGKIFQLFHRLHTMEKTEGTGIGLALCKKIVQNHGGRISVSSAPGKGTTFTLILPFRYHY